MSEFLHSEFDALFRSSRAERIFSTASRWQAMLRFEAALAAAEAAREVIPAEAATCIAASCRLEEIEVSGLAEQSRKSGNVAIPLIRALTDAVAKTDEDAAAFVHWGATSQDVIDTALILQLQQYIPLLDAMLRECGAVLAELTETHRDTVMAGRTLLQQAVPTTFGLKTAGWLDAMLRHRARLHAIMPRVLTLQFGGAAGTLASLGSRGRDIAERLAAELSLALPAMPWHTERDRIAEFCAWHGLLIGTLGKMARDIALGMQTEVGELSEAVEQGRGGSSTMPHKRNPVACTLVLSSALRVPNLVSTMLLAMGQEHERAVGGWHAEWETVPEICLLTASALEATLEMLRGLVVDKAAMQRNLALTGGLLLAEAVSMELAKSLGRMDAQKIVAAACEDAIRRQVSLQQTLAENSAVCEQLPLEKIEHLLDPRNYLGDAGGMIDRVLAEWRAQDFHRTKEAAA